MYHKPKSTQHPPEKKPLMVWDGKCGFCHYWVIRWKLLTGDKVDYEPYTKVAADFPDIPVNYFKEAVRLIEPDGRVYNGAEAAFRAFTYGSRWGWLYDLYQRLLIFRWISHRVYLLISKNRPFLFKITVLLFGKNPRHQQPYWAGWLVLIFLLVYLFSRYK